MRPRWTVNIGPRQRVFRVLLGAVAAVVSVVLLVDATTRLTVALEGVLLVTALDVLISGLSGHCPLLAALSRTSPSRTLADDVALPWLRRGRSAHVHQ